MAAILTSAHGASSECSFTDVRPTLAATRRARPHPGNARPVRSPYQADARGSLKKRSRPMGLSSDQRIVRQQNELRADIDRLHRWASSTPTGSPGCGWTKRPSPPTGRARCGRRGRRGRRHRDSGAAPARRPSRPCGRGRQVVHLLRGQTLEQVRFGGVKVVHALAPELPRVQLRATVSAVHHAGEERAGESAALVLASGHPGDVRPLWPSLGSYGASVRHLLNLGFSHRHGASSPPAHVAAWRRPAPA